MHRCAPRRWRWRSTWSCWGVAWKMRDVAAGDRRVGAGLDDARNPFCSDPHVLDLGGAGRSWSVVRRVAPDLSVVQYWPGPNGCQGRREMARAACWSRLGADAVAGPSWLASFPGPPGKNATRAATLSPGRRSVLGGRHGAVSGVVGNEPAHWRRRRGACGGRDRGLRAPGDHRRIR